VRGAVSAAGRRPAARSAVCALALVAAACSRGPGQRPRVVHVPADAPTIQAAVLAAHPGDLVLVAPGTYAGDVTVPRSRPGLTIRGETRNGVVIDGRDRTPSGITVRAEDVTVENITLHSFLGNALVWDHVDGYTARYVTVWNAGGYGMYAIASRHGAIDRSLVSGAGDAAFYVGECHPCDATISGVTAMLSGLGYSGTNAGGGLVVRDSVFDRNGTGILPNSFDDEADPPQRDMLVVRNRVTGSGSVPTPATDPVDGLIGIGIGVAGGRRDAVRGNVVTASDRYGIALFATVQPEGHLWRPAGTAVTGNRVSGSGLADLALAAGAGRGNCFAGNRFATSRPAGIERAFPCGSAPAPDARGDESVSSRLEISTPEALARSGPHPSYASMPRPGRQPEMPGGASGGSAAVAVARDQREARLEAASRFRATFRVYAWRITSRMSSAEHPFTR
jgi:Right handed beta helix region